MPEKMTADGADMPVSASVAAEPIDGKRRRRMATPLLPVRDTVHFPLLVSSIHVARDRSLLALQRSLSGERLILVVSQRDMSVDEPSESDLHSVGTLCEVQQAIPLPDATIRATLRGLVRAKVGRIFEKNACFWAEYTIEETQELDDIESEALSRSVLSLFEEVVHLNRDITPEALEIAARQNAPGALADIVTHFLPLNCLEKQTLLEESDAKIRLNRVLQSLHRERTVRQAQLGIEERLGRELAESQRDMVLREQLRIIQDEIRKREGRLSESELIEHRIRDSRMPPEAMALAQSEAFRINRIPPGSSEHGVVLSFLDSLLAVPWGTRSEDRIDLDEAERILNENHYGLTPVKSRIMEQLAVYRLKGTTHGTAICLVGAPGVGKTSFAAALARALNRKMVRVALGGIRDEAEIRGHRRTYVGAMPGRIASALREAGTMNPVIVLDEIDKIAGGPNSAPLNALLEALDPTQNPAFVDHFLDVPLDLSEVLFVATANEWQSLSAPLRDRLEPIVFPSYTDEEKMEVATRYLIPRSLARHGLSTEALLLSDQAVTMLIRDYAQEPGVRRLGRTIDALVRKTALAVARNPVDRFELTATDLQGWLGDPPTSMQFGILEGPGVAWCLMVSEVSGHVLPIEVALSKPIDRRGELTFTGNLGDVLRESALAALTYVRSCYPDADLHRRDIHVHVPDASIPKDGPSAGLALVAALSSAVCGTALDPKAAYTGEVSLRGHVLTVGGLREKILAAKRKGLTTLYVPLAARKEILSMPESMRDDLDLRFVGHADPRQIGIA